MEAPKILDIVLPEFDAYKMLLQCGEAALWNVKVRLVAATLDGKTDHDHTKEFNVVSFSPGHAQAEVLKLLTPVWYRDSDKDGLSTILFPAKIEFLSVKFVTMIDKPKLQP